MRLVKLDDLDEVFNSYSVAGSGLPQSDEAHEEFDENDVEERREIESLRLRRGEI